MNHSLHILHTESSPNWGGQEMRILEQIRWLIDQGHRGWIAAHPASRIAERATSMGLPVFPLAFRGSANPVVFMKLLRFVREKGIHVIDAHGSRDAQLCAWLRLFGYPVVRSVHVTKPIARGITHTPYWKYGADRIIVTAKLLRERLAQVGLDPQRIDVIGEGIDLARFHPEVPGEQVRRELGIASHTHIVVNIGMIRPDKGQLFFVEAAALVHQASPDVRFLLVGQGTRPEFEEQVRQRIQERDLDGVVTMTGYREDVPEIIAAADCVVLASVDVEAQSRVVPQAFAMRRPVVATDVGAVAELVGDRTGWLVPGQNIPAMAEAVLDVLDKGDPARVETAFQLATSRLGFERMMAKTLQSYRTARVNTASARTSAKTGAS
ncbi:MAG: glycosyltransferase family 1 protein [Desulfovibrionales bacterium]|nr:MAG: glycosyltransferase family 1 protein [Desulfovibrionales bacterium]